jgi:hypothetical protein
MTNDELLEELVRLAGDLFPRDGADPAELAAILGHLVRALRGGQSPNTIGDPSAGVRPWPRSETVIDTAALATMRQFIAQPGDGHPATIVLRRTQPSPAALVPRGLPAQMRGRRRSRTFGPFLEVTTRSVWFDVFEAGAGLMVARAGPAGPAPILVLSGIEEWTGARLEIDRGDLWLRAILFDPTAPSDGWFGIPLAAATLESDHALAPSGAPGRLVAPGDAVIHIFARPATPDLGPTVPSGAGARTVRLTIDAELVLTLAPGGGTIMPPPAALELFGQTAALTPEPGATARFDPDAEALLLPVRADAERFTPVAARSGIWLLRGEAPITAAALAFTICRIATADPATLGPAEDAPAVALDLGGGLTVEAAAMRDAAGAPVGVALAHAKLIATTGALWLGGTPPAHLPGEERLSLAWSAPGALLDTASGVVVRHAGLASIELTSEARAGATAADAVIRRSAPFRATLARPATADGRPLVLEGRADVADTEAEGIAFLALAARSIEPAFALQPRGFALENGFLRARALTGFMLDAHRAANRDRLEAGWITLAAALDLVVPTLAHPYASDFLPWDDGRIVDEEQPPFTAVIAADWRGDGAVPEVVVGLLDGRADPLAAPGAERASPPNLAVRQRLATHHRESVARDSERRRLLDLSGATDFLGVALHAPRERVELHAPRAMPLAVDGMALTHALDWTDLFLSPGFLNEALGNLPNPNVLPFPDRLDPIADGGPQRLAADAPGRVLIDPLATASALIGSFGQVPLRGLVNLPFGIAASVSLDAAVEGGGQPEPIAPQIADRESWLEPAWQLRLRATASAPGQPLSLPGFAHQQRLGRGSGGEVTSALGGDLETFFNGTFSALGGAQAPRVPVERLDLGGRGSSLVSLWTNPALVPETAQTSGVSEVRFTATLGRTSLEIVQVTSLCHPWCAPLVRDVTIRRSRSGTVWRSDSGWRAAGDGRFAYQGLPEAPELGLLRRLTAIRNIRETAEVITHPSGMRLRAVRFEALAEIEGAETLVPVRDLLGWVEVTPAQDPRPAALSAELLRFALTPTPGTSRGGCFGQLQAPIRIGDARQVFHASTLGVELGTPAPLLVGVIRGHLALPTRGAWNVVRRDGGASAHRRLAAGESVPLTGRGGTLHLREAVDLIAPQPAVEYALLHASDAHRFLLPDPRVQAGFGAIEAGAPPLFSDQFAMARSATLGPPVEDCIPLPAGTHFVVPEVGHLALVVPGGPIEVPAPAGELWRQLTLERTGPDCALRLEYRGRDERPARLDLQIDTRAQEGRDWSLELGPICVTSDVEPFGRFSTAEGMLRAASDRALRIDDLGVRFSGALGAAQSFMDILSYVTFPKPRPTEEVPPGPEVKREEVHYSPIFIGTSFDVPVKDPVEAVEDLTEKKKKHDLDPVAEWVDIGAGKFKGKFEFVLRIGQLEKSRHHQPKTFSEVQVEISGRLLSVIIAPLYAGGAFKLKYEWKAGARPDVGQPVAPEEQSQKLELQAGGIGFVGADFQFAEVEAQVGIIHVLSFEGVKNPFDKVKYGIKYQIEGEAELLKGLASAAVGFECMVVPSRGTDATGQPTEEVSFRLQGAVVVELGAAWVFKGEHEFEFEHEFSAGLPTLAAFVLSNPYFLAGELV